MTGGYSEFQWELEHTSLYAVWRWEQFPGATDLDPCGSRGLVGFAGWGLDVMIFEDPQFNKTTIGNFEFRKVGDFFGGVGLEHGWIAWNKYRVGQP